MKRLFAFVLTIVTAFCLTACSVPGKNETTLKNGLDQAFSAQANITLDRLDAQGTIKRFGDGLWEIEFDTPNTLSGIKLEFGEGNVDASYKGLSFSVPQSALPVKAMMLNLMEAVDTNARLDELKGEEKDGLLTVSGSLDGGDYTITVDKDGTLSCFEMPNNKLKIVFLELTPMTIEQEEAPEEATEQLPEETTAPEQPQ